MKQFGIIILLTILTFSAKCQEIVHEHSIFYSFIENKGQWDPNVLFQSKFQGGNLWIQQQKFVFHLADYSQVHDVHTGVLENPEPKIEQTVVHLNFPGSNIVTNITKSYTSKEYYNYMIGNVKQNWTSEVRGYGEATMHEFYNGIDLKLIENSNQLKYEFHVAPKIDPSVIKLEFAGNEKLTIDKDGNLIIKTRLGIIMEQKPYCYQVKNGKIVKVDAQFKIDNNQVGFVLGNYDKNIELVIDPVLIFATYSGSVTDNFGMTATYGYDGTAYTGGTIFGNAYPTPDNTAYDVNSNFTVANNPTYGITDVFISKYSPDGTTMLWTTFMGGGDGNNGTETVHSLICDKSNNLYFFGATSSIDFPIQGGYQATHGGGASNLNFLQNGVYFTNQGTDIYVAKISANGQNLLGSTYMGGSANDGVNYKVTAGNYSTAAAYDSLTSNYGDQFRGEIMLDTLGNCIVASCTRSSNFPTANAFDNTLNGQQDGVIFKLSNNLSSLQWSSYFGGTQNDACYSVKIDSSYNIVFAGGTVSNDLPGVGASYQNTYSGGKADGYVSKLTPDGLSLVKTSYIGTPSYDQTYFVEIDRFDNIYLIGQSQGGFFPVVNAAYSNPGSAQFIIKLDPTMTTNINSTVFGNGSGNINISPSAFLVDICGNIYVSGWGANILQSSPLNGMPTTANAFQATSPNGFDFYLFVLERTFNNILYGTYLGGNQAGEHVDGGTSRFDKNGVVYQSVCGGCGGFSDFPTSPGAWSANNLSSNCNNIVFKFDFELIPKAEFTANNTIGCVDFSVTLDNFSTTGDSYLWDFGNGDTTSQIFEPTIIYDTPGTYQVFLYVTDSVCLLTDTASITINVYDSLQLSVGPDIFLCVPNSITLVANSNGTANSFVWSESITFPDTLNTSISDSTLTITPSGNTTYYVKVSNDGCDRIDSVVVSFVSSSLSLSLGDSICVGDLATLSVTNTNPLINFNYTWSPASSIVGPNTNSTVTASPPVSSYIYITADDGSGCIVQDSIFVLVSNINPVLLQAIASDTLVASGSTVVLTAQPSGYSYLWTPSNLVSSPTSQQTNATINTSTTFVVFISDGICTKSASVFVKSFEYECADPYLFIPSGFTPNADGENDVLYVRGNVIQEMLFRVFDRWGEMVFESTDRTIGWDGTYKGKQMDPDTYDYYLKVTCVDNQENIIKGNVTLLR